MKNIILILLLLIFYNITNNLCGQNIQIDNINDDSISYKITLNDATEFTGKIIRKDSNSIVVKTIDSLKIDIPVNKIKNIIEIKNTNFSNIEYWTPNPTSTDYFVFPSAIPMKKAKVYYQNIYLVLNSFNWGITDFASIGTGFEVISVFGSFSSGKNYKPIFFVSPKLGFNVKKNFYVGAGLMYTNLSKLSKNDDNGLGITFGNFTLGNTNTNATIGFAWGFTHGDLYNTPIVTVSAMARIFNAGAFMIENWIFTNNKIPNFHCYGFRYISKNETFDLGFILIQNNLPIFIFGTPYLKYVYNF